MTGSLGNIQAYVSAVQHFPMMSAEEEAALVKQPQGEMRDRLITAYLRMAASIARDYTSFPVDYDELVQVANLGLLKAAEKFDPDKGRFHNIAISYIRAELNEFILRNHRMVKMATTKAQRKLYFNLGKEKSKLLRGTNRRSLTIAEMKALAEKLDVKMSDVREMEMRMGGGDTSISADPNEEGEGFSYEEILGDSEHEPTHVLGKLEHEWMMSCGVEEVLAKLDERSAGIIRLRYVNETTLTLHEVATIYGISAERVRQIEAKALLTMRHHMQTYA